MLIWRIKTAICICLLLLGGSNLLWFRVIQILNVTLLIRPMISIQTYINRNLRYIPPTLLFINVAAGDLGVG